MNKISFICVLLILCGCAGNTWERQLGEEQTPRTDSAIDLSSGLETGQLVLESRPPSIQYMIKSYQVTIDDKDPFLINKHSNTEIKLDAGVHTFVIQAPKFGKASKIKVDLRANDIVILEYVGPYWMASSGKLERRI